MQPPRYSQLLGLLGALALGLGVLLPLALLASRTLEREALALLVAADTWGVIARSALQAAASTAAALALGLPAAWGLAQPRLPLARLWRSIFIVPFVLPSLVAATAVLAFLGPRGLLGLDLRDTWWIVVAAHAFYNVGVVARIVGQHLSGSTARLLEAASTLGASPWRRALRVTLPSARPAILAAAALVFLFSFTSFGIVLMLAPHPTFATLEVEVYRRVARTFDLSAASALALLQLVLVLLIARPYLRAQRRSAVELSPSRLASPLSATPAVALAAVAPAALLVLLPLGGLLALTLAPPAGASLAGAWASLTTPSRFVGVTDLATALGNSLRFGLAGATLALLVGGSLALAIVRGGWRWLDTLSVVPWAVSAVTLGLGVLLVAPNLAASAWGIPIAHALLATPLVVRIGVAGLSAIPTGIREAAATLGATPWRTLWRLEGPLSRGAWAGAAAFAFAASLGEFGAAMLLRRPETVTLPVAIAERLGRPGAANYAEALLLSALLALLVALTVALIDRLGGRGSEPF